MRGHKTGGRKAGVPNKRGAIREMILKALDNAGGVKYLERQAANNPTAFMSLIGRVVPHEVTGADGEPFRVIFEAHDSRVL